MGLGLLALLATPVLAPSSASTANEGPEGISSLASLADESGYDVRLSAISPTQATGWPASSTLLVVGDSPAGLLPPAAGGLAAWASEGGLLVADGRGGTAPLLDALEVPATDRRVLDASLGEDPRRVPAEVTVDQRSREVVLEQPFAVDRDALGDRWTPVAETSEASFVDLNGNGRLDRGDARGPFVVGVSDGSGTVVLTSGALLLNHALEEEPTHAVVEALLLSGAPEGGTVVVDASHAGHGLPGTLALSVLRSTVSLLSGPLWGTVAAAALVVGTAGLLAGRTREVDDWSGTASAAEVTGEEKPLDVGFMTEVLASVVEDAAGGDVPDRHRALLQRLRQAGAETGSTEA